MLGKKNDDDGDDSNSHNSLSVHCVLGAMADPGVGPSPWTSGASSWQGEPSFLWEPWKRNLAWVGWGRRRHTHGCIHRLFEHPLKGQVLYQDREHSRWRQSQRWATAPSLVLLRDGCLLLLFVEKFLLLSIAAWGQAGWVGGESSSGGPLGEKIGEVGKGLILDSTSDART